MMRNHYPRLVLVFTALLLLIGGLSASLAAAQAAPLQQISAPDRPIVCGVMFWSEGCPHCEEVMQFTLPPLQKQFGDPLQIQLIEVSSLADIQRFQQVAEEAGVGRERAYVPFLIIGDQVLIGAEEIPAKLSGLIEQGLAAGGIGYPDLPSLSGLVPATTPDSPGLSSPQEPLALSLAQAVAQDLSAEIPIPTSDGFTLAIVIMIGMALALVYAISVIWRGVPPVPLATQPPWLSWLTPLLALAGLGVAGYLTYVETQPVAAVCGPVGDCNAVQSSPYARLFGVIPVGLLGAIGYVGILIAWAVDRWGRGRLAEYAPLALFGIAFLGTAFSLYLTYLEPFVIHAVCIWCLTSAVIITLILLLNLTSIVQTIKEDEDVLSPSF